MPGAKISALGCYVPPGVLTNHDLEKMVETNDEWILDADRDLGAPHRARRTWRRPIWPLKPRGSRSRSAASKPSELDAIIVCTVTPDMLFPSTACLVQDRLGAERRLGFRPGGRLLRVSSTA